MAKSKRKSNGADPWSGLEVLNADGKPVANQARAGLPRTAAPECVILRPRPDTEIFCACYRGQWRATHRFDLKCLGSHKYIQLRPFGGGVRQGMLAALEHACGRDGALDYIAAPEKALEKHNPAKVEPDGAVVVEIGQAGRKGLSVRYRGAWLTVARWSRFSRGIAAWPEVPDAIEREKMRGPADQKSYPDLSTV